MNANPSSRFTLLKAIILPLIATALLLSACGYCPNPAQQLPDGVYTTIVAVEDLMNIGAPPETVCENAGTFNLTVTGKRWSFFQTAAPGCIVKNPTWSGDWKFCGDEVAITEGAQSYTYKWAFDGAELRFTRVDDTVVTRIVYLTNYPWVLRK